MLTIGEDEVHVWRASLDLDESRIGGMRSSLSADERARADRLRLERERAWFVAGRWILRAILARYLATAPQRLEFSYGPHGKPALAPGAGADWLRFNVSHSDGLALYAVARGREVGIDLDLVGRSSAEERIAERFFSPREAAALRALPRPARRRAFSVCWTRKEAYVKAIGGGLQVPLDGFEVPVAPGDPPRLLSVAGGGDEASRWTLVDVPVGSGFVAALAVERGEMRIRLLRWEG